MNINDAEFFKKLLSTFKIEAHEHLRNISLALLNLEKTVIEEEKKKNVETIHREFHSLKGAARAVNVNEIENICHVTENIFAKIKKENITLNAEMFDLFNLVVDSIEDLLSSNDDKIKDISSIIEELKNFENTIIEGKISVNNTEIKPNIEIKKTISSIYTQNKNIKVNEEKSSRSIEEINIIKKRNSDTLVVEDKSNKIIRVSKYKLDSLMLQGEEMIYSKLSALERAKEVNRIRELIDLYKKEQKADIFNVLENSIDSLAKAAENDVKIIESMTDNFIDGIKEIMLLPFSSIIEIFPKMVRDLSRQVGKEVEFISKGTDIEIDRRILEEIKDSLMHIIRNCVDHGIEKVEERENLKKNRKGVIKLIVTQINSDVVKIEISDDGAGIDTEKIKEKVIKNQILTSLELAAIDEEGLKMLIFKSGMSTSDIITDISGRGLGLAIVYEKVHSLEGTIMVKSEKGIGTTFTIMLPITISTNRGIMVKEINQSFIIPTTKVEKVITIKKEEIKILEGRAIIEVEGEFIPIIKLSDMLEIKDKQADDNLNNKIEVLVVNDMENKIAFSVDEIIIEQEVLVKRFNKQLKRVRNIAGATILGSGEVVPILNVQDLIKTSTKNISKFFNGIKENQNEKIQKKSIIVVEDSITSRTLIKNILETAGYYVKTAVDGLQGWNMLKSEKFDLVITDVEMPELDGFQLTEKIRNDNSISQIPVILVTSLESKEDKERGIDVGASAYIVKSDFHQSNLLDIIKRLA